VLNAEVNANGAQRGSPALCGGGHGAAGEHAAAAEINGLRDLFRTEPKMAKFGQFILDFSDRRSGDRPGFGVCGSRVRSGETVTNQSNPDKTARISHLRLRPERSPESLIFSCCSVLASGPMAPPHSAASRARAPIGVHLRMSDPTALCNNPPPAPPSPATAGTSARTDSGIASVRRHVRRPHVNPVPSNIGTKSLSQRILAKHRCHRLHASLLRRVNSRRLSIRMFNICARRLQLLAPNQYCYFVS